MCVCLGRDLSPNFGDFSQGEKLSDIKPPLKKTIPAPINTAKRPSSENNFADPTQRKKFAPARPTPSTAKAEEASSSKKENFEVKTQVKDSR